MGAPTLIAADVIGGSPSRLEQAEEMGLSVPLLIAIGALACLAAVAFWRWRWAHRERSADMRQGEPASSGTDP